MKDLVRRPLRIGLVLLSATISAARGEDKNIRIVVREEGSAQGVVSKIIMLKGESEKTPIDDTDSTGVLALAHTCVLGERFVAEPKNKSYYQSDDAGCKKELVLSVVKRETPQGVLVERAARVVKTEFTDGSQATYLISWTGRVETNEPAKDPSAVCADFFCIAPGEAHANFEQAVVTINTTGGIAATETIFSRTITSGPSVTIQWWDTVFPGVQYQSPLFVLKADTAKQIDSFANNGAVYDTFIAKLSTKAKGSLLSVSVEPRHIPGQVHEMND